MDFKWLNQRKPKLLQGICMALCLMITMYDMVIHMRSPLEIPMWRTVLVLIVIAQFGVMCNLFHKKSGLPGRLMIGYLLWVIVTRMIVDGDNDRVLQGEICCAAEMCLVFLTGTLLEEKQRRTLLAWVTGLMTAVLLVWAICGFVLMLTDVEKIFFSPEHAVYFTEEKQQTGVLKTLQFFDIHRNESSVWFMVTIWLLFAQCFRCEKKWWRIPMGIAITVMYVMVAVLHSRSVQVITAGGVAMLVMILLMDRMKKVKLLPRLAVIVLAALLCAAVTYKGYGVCNQLLGKAPEPSETQQEEQMAQSEDRITLTVPRLTASPAGKTVTTVLPVKLAAEQSQMTDNRNFWKDLRTLTMRTEIWSAIAEAIKNNPKMLLFGQPESLIMENIREYGGLERTVPHTHNGFTQVLMLSGVVGLLLILALLVILVPKMVRCFFSDAPVSLKILTIPLTCLLIDGMMEPLFTAELEFSSIFFMLIAAIFLADFREKSTSAK